MHSSEWVKKGGRESFQKPRACRKLGILFLPPPPSTTVELFWPRHFSGGKARRGYFAQGGAFRGASHRKSPALPLPVGECGKAGVSRLKGLKTNCIFHVRTTGIPQAAAEGPVNAAVVLSVGGEPNPRGGRVHQASLLELGCLIKTI